MHRRVVVVDCETTGFKVKSDRIMEVAWASFTFSTEGKAVDRRQGSTLINPGKAIPFTVAALTNINDLMVKDKDAWVKSQTVEDLRKELKGAVLVCHNVRFDKGFLWAAWERAGIMPPAIAGTVDTLDLCQRRWPSQKNDLGAACKRLEIGHTDAHRATGDVIVTDKVLRLMVRRALKGKTNPTTEPKAQEGEMNEKTEPTQETVEISDLRLKYNMMLLERGWTPELNKALSKAQGAMRAASKDAINPFHKSKYASLDAVIEAARAPLAAHGLAVIQPVSNNGNVVTVATILLHESGEERTSKLTFPISGKGNPIQILGSIITYLRRYALMALLGIAPGDDDDGNAAKDVKHPGKPHYQDQGPPRHQRRPAPRKPAPPKTKPASESKPKKAGPKEWGNADRKWFFSELAKRKVDYEVLKEFLTGNAKSKEITYTPPKLMAQTHRQSLMSALDGDLGEQLKSWMAAADDDASEANGMPF